MKTVVLTDGSAPVPQRRDSGSRTQKVGTLRRNPSSPHSLYDIADVGLPESLLRFPRAQ
jgi:hypothetical protein